MRLARLLARLGVIVAVIGLTGAALPQRPAQDRSGARLHNGWRVTPAGEHRVTSDMLVGCAPSPDGKVVAMVAAGAGAHMLYLLDAATGDLQQEVRLGTAWNGIGWQPDGATLYVSGGASGVVHVLRRQADGSFADGTSWRIREPDARPQDALWLSGVAVSNDGASVFAAATATDRVYRLKASDGSIDAVRKLNDGARPGCIRISHDGSALYVAQWAASSIAVLDSATLELKRILTVGSHPNDILEIGDRLFVSCGNDDAVIVVQPSSGLISEWIVTRLTTRAPAGSTPNALACSPDGHTLYVANADNNCVAVADISKPGASRILGFIPTGWYPASVVVSPDGRKLIVGSGKGLGTGPNAKVEGPIDPVAPKGYPYIVSLLRGMISVVDTPDPDALRAYTTQTLRNSPYADEVLVKPRSAPRPGASPIPSRVGDPSPIKHVLYIIKENRTYDQVLGSLKDDAGKPLGNGDPRLTLFGEDVAPNHHALAREFVVLDNLYADGEVSVDGHHWSNAAYVPDFMARTWPQQYSARGVPPLTERLSDTPNGRIWDVCERHGVDFRTYYYHTRERMSTEWMLARGAGRRDYDYVDIFLKEFREFERTRSMPSFMIMALSEDHTRGTTPGAFTPKACVASNDLALGKIVETISKSSYWKDFAIFVIEDDAQNGPDHVDAHRTVGLAISPYTRRRGVDSTFYTTSSFLRTMELILGLPPMTQFDAAATPLYRSFKAKPDPRPYAALQPTTDMQARNPARASGAARMAAIDFSEPDRLTIEDEDALNRALWHSIKGDDTPYPGVRRRALW